MWWKITRAPPTGGRSQAFGCSRGLNVDQVKVDTQISCVLSFFEALEAISCPI